ncbi:alpha-amylase [Rhizobium sp. Leaf384]|uniref:maltotransferase domain-containing protein n=1 Tax=unclassified Rhizobium TaxID=2613769 RepID=UPI000715846D|nr:MULTISPECIES: maltotransferase domain-containing protein [unclassified Rhizobium]KQS76632.1 alpha-amylase [Rhizobium sp. Leaf383]KQS77900.1 alpha-amylase [Rhizobium sp. Leaf384]
MNVHSLAEARTSVVTPPRIYYVHPLHMRGAEAWDAVFAHAADLGFDTVLSAPLFQKGEATSVFMTASYEALNPELGFGNSVADGVSTLVKAARRHGLSLMLDIVVGHDAEPHPAPGAPVDPRISPTVFGGRLTGTQDEHTEAALVATWTDRLLALAEAGIEGFRCVGIAALSKEAWAQLIANVHQRQSQVRFLAWTPGTSFGDRKGLSEAGFEGVFSSLAWWNLQDRWLLDEYELQRDFAYQIAFPEAPFAKRIAHGTESSEVLKRRAIRTLALSATVGRGILIPMGFEFGAATPLDPMHGHGSGLHGMKAQGAFDMSSHIRAINEELAASTLSRTTPMTLISGSATPVSALVQGDHADLRQAEKVRVIVCNRDLRRSATVPFHAIREAASAFLPLCDVARPERALDADMRLAPGELRIFEGSVSNPILMPGAAMDARAAAATARLAIEKVVPAVDEGRFPVKRVVGDIVKVEADIFGDGHDPLAAVLLWRPVDTQEWTEVPMQFVVNDRWKAEFTLKRMGRHEYVLEAWRNPYAIFRYELGKKHEVNLDLTLEIQEGINLIKAAAENGPQRVQPELKTLLATLAGSDAEQKTQLLLSPETFALLARADRRPFSVRSAVIPVDAERKAAGFASWFQVFPRSQSGDANRHGTFDDVIGRLPAIRDMGFDVLYFPPIHPIGTTNRKGRNNTLTPGPNDPGSPYAIGSPEGGHDAIHPELGTFEDFRRLVSAAADHGLEIALDLAIQASPDHPWLKGHPGWFDWRPDGTIRYAENPPKKYEDIVNVDFYAKDAVPALWETLRDVVQVWVDQGVKLFRVDNPHTKPFPFWEWMIADIRGRHPDVVFLSEAFTKPKVMYRLAKVGFSQSYTYFTWRNAKWELEEYMREITTEAPKDFFRPHFFVNTHDINPDFLQNAPRSAYLIRAALAATLSGLWGVYNGFELCEGRPDAKRKEYADSEKYEIRAWDYDRPGHIKNEIALLNRIRRENTALHSHLGLTLLPALNDNILFFEKASAGRENVLLVAISLDPHNVQEADCEVPLWSWNLPDNGSLPMEDVIANRAFTWTGKIQRIRLDPSMPFGIWRVR